MLGIDKRHNSTHGLRLGQDLERQRGLTGGLGAVNLDDATTRHATDA